MNKSHLFLIVNSWFIVRIVARDAIKKRKIKKHS